MEEEIQICTFYLEGRFFGLNVDRVQEVLQPQQMTPVQLAPPEVEGLINLRGQIVTAVDLRRCLELPPRPEGKDPMNIVINTDQNDGLVSLLVDEIGDVVDVNPDLFSPPPETLDGVSRELIVGAYKLPEQLLLMLDTDKVLLHSTASST